MKQYNYIEKKYPARARNKRVRENGTSVASSSGGSILLGGGTITTLENDLKVTGNIRATGNVVAYATSDADISDWLSPLLDPTTLAFNESGLITVIGGSGGVDFTVGNGLQMSEDNILSVKFGVGLGTVAAGNDLRIINGQTAYERLTNGRWWGQRATEEGTVDGEMMITTDGIWERKKIAIGCETYPENVSYASILNTGNLHLDAEINSGIGRGGIYLNFYSQGESRSAVLANSGFLGLGTTNPIGRLHIKGNAYSALLYMEDITYNKAFRYIVAENLGFMQYGNPANHSDPCNLRMTGLSNYPLNEVLVHAASLKSTGNVIAYAVGGGDIVLPIASASALGAIKIGANLSIAPDGTLSGQPTGLAGMTVVGDGNALDSVSYDSNSKILSFTKNTNFLTTGALDNYVKKAGDTMSGQLVLDVTNLSHNFDEGLRINRSSDGWATMIIGDPLGSTAGITGSGWHIGLPAGSQTLLFSHGSGAKDRGLSLEEGINGLRWLDQTVYHSLNYSSILQQYRANTYGLQTVDLSGLDVNTYYPVGVGMAIHGMLQTFGVHVNLSNGASNVPSWATHPYGFTCNCEVVGRGSGWGTNSAPMAITEWNMGFYTGPRPLGKIMQVGTDNLLLFYLRGGGVYEIYNNNAALAKVYTYELNLNGTIVKPIPCVSVVSCESNEFMNAFVDNNVAINSAILGVSYLVCTDRLDVRGQIHCNDWIMTNNSGGWLNESFGGGMYMDDYSAVKIYGNKKLRVYNGSGDSIETIGGFTGAAANSGTSWTNWPNVHLLLRATLRSIDAGSYYPVIGWSSLINNQGYQQWASIGSYRPGYQFGSVVITVSRSDDNSVWSMFHFWNDGRFDCERLSCVYDSLQPGSISCSNWFRSNGNTGWFNDTHGGGIHMQDSTYVRVYGNKIFYNDRDIQSGSNVRAAGNVVAYAVGSGDITLPIATPSAYGAVKYDNSTIRVNSAGQLYATNVFNGGLINKYLEIRSGQTATRVLGNDISAWSDSTVGRPRLWLNYRKPAGWAYQSEVFIGNGDNAGTQIVTINQDGNGKVLAKNGTGYLSDIRYKNILSYDVDGDVLNKIQDLNFFYFKWRDLSDFDTHFGLSAQQVQDKFGFSVSEYDNTLNVDYPMLASYVAIQGLKEVKRWMVGKETKEAKEQKVIDQLRNRVAILEQVLMNHGWDLPAPDVA